MTYIRTIKLKHIWQQDKRIERARKVIIPMIEKDLDCSKIKYDSQDLEHQILFRMTTYSEKESFNKINEIFEEQSYITKERMKNAKISPEKLFQFGYKREDHKRPKLKWSDNKEKLFAIIRNKK